ncbi:hypothetical protein DYB35_000652 [Aphanomyces astaci]|uniref:Uncharacterized protein n=1 Tax=Aphanomyces astaci TaxID=112090 RepID=A0A418DEZ1_APHAT|nr:hypothetical protein DYB35_000652 [Aphanomyces astaci]
MTPVVNYRNPTSALTLAFFEDTGWYQANFSVAEPLLWGNNKGCAFSSDNCVGPTTTTSGNLKPVDVATYCAADGEACSPDGLSRSWCSLKTDYAADDIPPWFQYFASPTTGGYEILQVCADINVVLVVVHSQGDCLNASNLALIPNTNLTPMGEMYGNDTSRCTLSSLRLANMFGYEYRTRAAGCYPMTCHGQTVQVSVKAADNGVVTVQCKYKGQVVTVAGFTGTLTNINDTQTYATVGLLDRITIHDTQTYATVGQLDHITIHDSQTYVTVGQLDHITRTVSFSE